MTHLQIPKLDIISPDDFTQEQAEPDPLHIGQNATFTRSKSGLYLPVSLTKAKPM